MKKKTTTIGLISKKATFARAAHFFCTFLCRCFARIQRKTSRDFLVTLFLEEMSYVFSITFFSLPLIFTLCWWLLAFLSCHRRYKIFMVFFKKKSPFFISLISRSRSLSPFLSLSFAGLPPTFSFSLSFSCSIFQICGHDN